MKLKYIHLDKINDSGQTFRWLKLAQGHYVVPYNLGACEIIQTSEYEAEIVQEYGISQDWKHYFDEYRNYSKIDEEILNLYPQYKEATNFSKGIRILNQEAVETIFTFIFSANNNIKRIMNSVNSICLEYGEILYSKDDKTLYSFPSIEKMAKITEDEFTKFGAGYRAKYLVSTANTLLQSNDFKNWYNLSDEQLLKTLESLMGVGPKVARCIGLFSYSRESMFPVDTWIKKAIRNEYNMPEASDKQITDKINSIFTKHRGIIQQYIFYYYRFL